MNEEKQKNQELASEFFEQAYHLRRTIRAESASAFFYQPYL